MKKKKIKLVFETKPMTWVQRTEVNDIETEMNPVKGTVTVRDVFKQRGLYMLYGLKSIEGVEITEDNFDNEMMKLSNDEIETISNQIADECNFPKKK